MAKVCKGKTRRIACVLTLYQFPSLVDDAYIKPTGIVHRINENDAPSYKRVAWHYFRLRILQAEVLDVLLQRNIIRLEAAHPEIKNRYLHDRMKWGHLAEPQAFREWRDDMDRRLMEWKDTAPTSTEETSVRFATEFFELNYWQVIIMLYRQNLNVPIEYGGDLGSPDDNQGRNVPHNDDLDPDEKIPMKIFEAATKILHLYRHLHKRRLVNWTYLATHAIFITAVSLLYAVWHSAAVRENILSSEMKSYIDDGIFVLGDLAPMCPPAADLREKLTMLYRAVHWQYAVWLKAELDERQKLHGEPKDGRRGGRVPTANQMQQPMLSGSQLGALTRHHPSLDGRLMATAETSTATTPRSSMFSPSSTTSMSYQSVPSPNYNPIRSAPDTRDQYSAPYQPPFNPTPSRVQAQARMSQLQPYPAFSSHLPPHQQPRQRPFEYPPQTNLYAQPYQQEPQPLAYDLDPAVYRDLDLGLGLPYDFSAVFPPQVPLDTGAGAGTDPSSPSTAHDRMQDVDVDAAEAEPYPMTGNEHMTGYDMGGFIKLGHDMGAQGMPIGGQFFHPDFEGFFFGGGNENMGANGLNGYGGVDGGDGQQQQQEGEYGQGY